MQIQLEEGQRSEVYRGCSGEHGPSQRQAKRWLEQESMGNTVVEEIGGKICLAQRQRDMERAETRRAFVLGRTVSCSSGDLWRRTELDLGSSESFDDLHGSATVGAAIKIRSVFGGGSVLFRLWFWGCAQQLKAK